MLDKPSRTNADLLLATMEAIVRELDPVTREIFVLHRLNGWPYERIARERSLTIAEVEAHIASAVCALDLGLSRRGR